MKRPVIAFSLILSMSSFGGHTLPVWADEPAQTVVTNVIAPRLTLINSITPYLSTSGTTASYSLSVSCVGSVKSINATLQLQRKNSDGSYSNYGSSWTASSSASYLTASGTKSVASGDTYRLKVTVTASDGSSSGSATVYS